MANLSRVDGAEEWKLFGDGFPPAVAGLMEAVDRERCRLLRALGPPEVSLAEWMRRFYAHQGIRGETLHALLSTAPVFQRSTGPRSVQDRYVDEDVPYGLVPAASIAAAFGERVPLMNGLIDLLAAPRGVDFRRTGRHAERLGLAGRRRDEIAAVLGRAS